MHASVLSSLQYVQLSLIDLQYEGFIFLLCFLSWYPIYFMYILIISLV